MQRLQRSEEQVMRLVIGSQLPGANVFGGDGIAIELAGVNLPTEADTDGHAVVQFGGTSFYTSSTGGISVQARPHLSFRRPVSEPMA